MASDQQRINIPALVVLAILTGGTAGIGGVKFSAVEPGDVVTSKDIQNIQREVDELKSDMRIERERRSSADEILVEGAEKIRGELIEFREKCKHVEWRCQRLERGDRNATQ